MAVVGTTIFKMDGNPYFSPQFPRGGLAGTFSADVMLLVGSPTVTITVQTRNSEDTSWTDLGAFSAITATGAASVDLTGCEEILRFKYTFDAGDDATDGVHFLMQAPAWRPY
jgi:hypothetical protein